MKMFRLFLLVAILFGAFPAVSGACDGLFSRVVENRAERKERRSESVFGFGVVKARSVVIVTSKPAKVANPAPVVQAPPLRFSNCINGKCFE